MKKKKNILFAIIAGFISGSLIYIWPWKKQSDEHHEILINILSYPKFQDTIDMVLFNNGGLRSSLSEGNITKRDIYQLMPFENELVVLSLSLDDVDDLMNYLNHTGGQPSAFSDWFQIDELPFYVLTTDYLANGGDKMRFFNNKYQNVLGVKMRDAIIQYCSQKDTIASQLDNRHLYFMSDE